MTLKLNPLPVLLGAATLGVVQAVALLALSGCSAVAARDDDRRTSSEEQIRAADRPTLEYLGTELRVYGDDDDPYFRFMDIIRFSNPTPFAWEFWGEDITWPLCKRAFPLDSGGWGLGTRMLFCATGIKRLRIEPGQAAIFPAHSKRSTVLEEAGKLSRIELELTNAETGEVVVVCTEGYLPKTTPEDEERTRKLDEYGNLRK